MPFKTIVVAVDFSEESEAALALAIELAQQSDATLHLINAYEVIAATPPMMGVGIPSDLVNSLREASAKQMAEWVERAEQGGVTAHGHLSPASPSLAIVATTEEVGGDLVVMGTRGLSGLKHVVLGSVAERTLRTSPCPVLTVKA